MPSLFQVKRRVENIHIQKGTAGFRYKGKRVEKERNKKEMPQTHPSDSLAPG